MQKFIFLFFLIINSNAVIGGWDPGIQAVCRVKMSNGNEWEGFITVGIPYEGGTKMNGFVEQCISNKEIHNKLFVFDLQTRSLNFEADQKCFGDTELTSKIKFVKFINDSSSLFNPTIISNHDTLSFSISTKNKYIMLDSIVIYNELPTSTYLDTIDRDVTPYKKMSITKLNVNDIIRFELIEKPVFPWTYYIDLANKKFAEFYSDDSGDFSQATWFHDIIANKENYEYYNCRINNFNGIINHCH